ncbi:MAG: hypothetical protein JWM21_1461 [Acidobacteria bacterium]|nr:hypothetical protein [Acidobacteriota bacterium]
MPKLFEYLGIIVLFYSNEHEPIHVHGKYQGRESKADLILRDGKIIEIIISSVKGKRPLLQTQLKDFQELTQHFADEIVQKWIDYFVLHKPIQARRITTRIN